MRIAVDLDNVTLSFQDHWAQLYAEWFDTHIDPVELTAWDAITDATHFRTGAEFFDWFHRAGGWDNMPWIPGAPGGIDHLIGSGHQVTFVTARSGDAVRKTRDWHQWSPWPDVPLRFAITKSALDLDLYIDDAPPVAQDVLASGKPVIVFDQPWNRDLPQQPLLYRAHGWREVVEYVEAWGVNLTLDALIDDPERRPFGRRELDPIELVSDGMAFTPGLTPEEDS
jgi:uncharacterized HAD superfamily protein